MVFILQFGEDRHDDLTNVNSGHCAPRASQRHHTDLSGAWTGDNIEIRDLDNCWKIVSKVS